MKSVNSPLQSLLTAIAVLWMASCTATRPVVPVATPCVAKNFAVIDDFSGARRGACRPVSDNHVEIRIVAEDDATQNDSAWYAFKLVPQAATRARITLRYSGGHHRYRPKISKDGVNWQLLDERNVHKSHNGRRADIEVPLTDEVVWVAAQELITPATFATWNEDIGAASSAKLRVLGLSGAGVPIKILDSNPESRETIMLVGRQHPPEVSGSIAFFAFVETLLANTDIAQEFRKRYRLLVIPLLNPDGVRNGHWRHNLGGVDLNRDWGPFTQPETRLVRDLLNELDSSDSHVRFFLDFHSTRHNLFYTQTSEDVTRPAGFAVNWFAKVRPRLQNYSFRHEVRPVSETPTAKNYMYKRYGIPSITYEVGDETERSTINAAAQIFAEEMMLLMLNTSR